MLKSPTGRPTVEVVKTHAASPVLPDLVAQLGRQRQLVEYLLFKLLEAQLLLSSDQAAFVPIAMAEIESVLRRIREEEERREELISSLAEDWGMPPHDLKLAYLTEHAPEPYRTAFSEHRRTFMSLVDQVEKVTRDNRRLATEGLARVQAALSGLVEDASTYSPEGRVEKLVTRPVTHDKVI